MVSLLSAPGIFEILVLLIVISVIVIPAGVLIYYLRKKKG